MSSRHIPTAASLFVLAIQLAAQSEQEIPVRIRAAREIKLPSQVAGIVLERPVARGQEVKKGEVLLRLDPVFFRLSVEKAAAGRDKALADAAWADSELSRARSLAESGSLTTEGLDRIVAQHRSALAAVRLAEATLKEAEEQLARTEVRAPIDGRVIEIWPEVAEAVTLGVPVIHLVSVGDLQAECFVLPEQVSAFRVGAEFSLRIVERPGTVCRGIVREIAEAAATDRTFRLVLSLLEPPQDVRAGHEARIVIRNQR